MRTRLTNLFKNLTVYGLGDVATNIVSFLLLPIYVRHLSPSDYGVISLLLSVEVVAKIVFRFGLDASFMRLYFDCHDLKARQRLASTLFLFLFIVDGAVLLVVLAFADPIGRLLFGTSGYALVLSLTLVNIFLMGFSFIPFHVLRIEEKSGQFIALTFARSAATLVARLVLVVGFSMGILGVVLADIIVSSVVTLALLRWYAPLIRPVFSRSVLTDALNFGLPRLPHGLAHQVIAVSDRYVLRLFVPLRDIGIYSIGATFGLALKLVLNAFEYAWAPFYFSIMKEPDAKATFSLVTTYGVAVLVFMAAGLSAVARDVVRLMTTPEFYGAAEVVPWIGLGVLLQGIYLLTSIGLNITKNTRYYPLATGMAAAASVGANLLLVPRFGILGSAWANTVSYATLAGVSMWFSQRVYPVRYEYGRLAKIAVSGIAAYMLARVIVPASFRPLAGALANGAVVAIAYPSVLVLLGFHSAREAAQLIGLAGRFGRRTVRLPQEETSELAGEIVTAPFPDETEPAEEVVDVVKSRSAGNGAA